MTTRSTAPGDVARLRAACSRSDPSRASRQEAAHERSPSVAVLAGVTLVAALSAEAAEPPTITAAQASEYVGKRVKVCGEIAAVGRAFAKREGGKQVFLHFDKAPPDSPFVAVVIGYDLEKSGAWTRPCTARRA